MIVPNKRFDGQLDGLEGLDLSGLGTCQVPTPGVTMFYPPCEGAYTGVPITTEPAVYHAPVMVGAPQCSSGPSMFTSECITQLLANQQQDMAAASAANRAVFLQNCNRDWSANDGVFANLHLPRPRNDCAERGFGLTLPGSTGSYVGTPNDRTPIGGGGGTGIVCTQPNIIRNGVCVDPFTGQPIAGGQAVKPLSVQISPSKGIYAIGEAWTLLITGPPGQQVAVVGGKNGDNSINTMGATDSGGRFTLSGTFTADQVGSWHEEWKVGGQSAGVVNFAVQGQASSNVKDAMDKKTADTGGTTGSQVVQDALDAITGSGIPSWAIYAAVGLGAVMLLKSH